MDAVGPASAVAGDVLSKCEMPTPNEPAVSSPDSDAFLPARRVPLLYLGFAHVCLGLALAIVVADPLGVGGFFYHPHLMAVVHLVTLGFISASILGSIQLVAPLALRAALPARRLDTLGFAAFAIGVAGMASHFWLATPVGVAWAGGLVLLVLAHVSFRVLRAVGRAPLPREARLPVMLAFANLLAAGGAGLVLAVNKAHPFLPCSQLQAVAAHAHLAAAGWAAMMVIGAGQRLLPMMLPAAMPRGNALLAAPLLLEAGILGLVASLAFGAPLLAVSALAMAAGVLAFVAQVALMLKHGRPAPSAMLRPDWSVAHALQALAYLAAASGLGLFLALTPPSEATLRATMVYGVCGLVGFLAQIVVGVEGRLLPLAAWVWSFAEGGRDKLPTNVHALPSRGLQAVVFALWTPGVPLLAVGLAWEQAAAARAGGLALLLAVALSGLNALHVLAHARTRRGLNSR